MCVRLLYGLRKESDLRQVARRVLLLMPASESGPSF